MNTLERWLRSENKGQGTGDKGRGEERLAPIGKAIIGVDLVEMVRWFVHKDASYVILLLVSYKVVKEVHQDSSPRSQSQSSNPPSNPSNPAAAQKIRQHRHFVILAILVILACPAALSPFFYFTIPCDFTQITHTFLRTNMALTTYLHMHMRTSRHIYA